MSTVVSLQVKDISTYRSLVLLAQTEIADTFLMAGQFDRAADYYRRVLKLGDSDLNEAQIRLKLVKAVFELKDWKGVLAEGLQCIEKAALSSQIAEVRFLMAEAYKKLGMHQEAIQQTLELLNTEQEKANKDPDNWAYWQKRTGNKLANELYEQGDYLNALLIYETLFKLPGNAEWHSQALYQIGLIYERLFQPDRAAAAYSEIISQPTNAAIAVSATNTAAQATATSSTNGALSNLPQPAVSGKKVATPSPAQPVSPGLNLIREMALWRLNNLRWDQKVNQEVQKIFLPNTSSTNNRISEPQNSTP
jgi:tetratricopeptide (TPR) repeat protein